MKIHEALLSLREKEGGYLLLLMDIDNFKQINDTFGHRFGDQVLKEVSHTLQKKFRRDDILGRLGGDEFVVLLTNAAEYEVMEPVFSDLCKKLKKTYMKDGKSVTISASFGIVEAPKYGKTFHDLYEKSDRMLYEVKKNQVGHFTTSIWTINEEHTKTLSVCRDKNTGVEWFTFEEALKASAEPWMVEHVYKKLLRKIR